MSILNNPYPNGSITHQEFDNSLRHFNRMNDEQLQIVLVENQSKANNHSTYNFDQMDFFERECRAIQTVIDSRAK